MYRGRVVALLVSALAVAVLGAGCGGGDDAEAMSRAEFVKQADAICQKGNEATRAGIAALEGKRVASKQTGEPVTAVILPSLQVQADELSELGVPDGDEAQVEAIVGGLEEAIEKGEKNPLLVLEAKGPFARVGAAAKAYGLEVCVQ